MAETKRSSDSLVERRILVVEDSRTQAERLRLLLEHQGYLVEVAGNGREGLERARASAPDLIVSDGMMPEMDGYALCRALKATETTKRIPIVLLTQQRTPTDILRGLEVGADNFITKPFEDGYLLERISRIFDYLGLQQGSNVDMEVNIRAGAREIAFSMNRGQILELLFSTLEDLDALNRQLRKAHCALEEHAQNLEKMVEDRTQRLLQTEKLATMGQLLAGVAHELNNPLSVILGQAALLRHAVGEGPAADRVEKMGQAAERCARIVRNFLALARQRPPERQSVDLNRIVHDAVELLGYHLRVDNVKVELRLEADLLSLCADPNQLHQVLINLITNAHHAMRESPPPRRLTVATQSVPAERRVVVEVTDTGPGIPPEVQSRIFEPFFTTKADGEGTGLGLPLCKGMIEEHGGTIHVANGQEGGVTFRVELPMREAASEVAQAMPHAPASQERGAHILVVDDEPIMAELLKEVLSVDGHQVDTAHDGNLALELLGQGPYDLILSDIRMPGLDGPGFYREVARRHPALSRRFVFVTGDHLRNDTKDFLEKTVALSLNKPFAAEDLLFVVQRALAVPLGSAFPVAAT